MHPTKPLETLVSCAAVIACDCRLCFERHTGKTSIVRTQNTPTYKDMHARALATELHGDSYGFHAALFFYRFLDNHLFLTINGIKLHTDYFM